MDENHKDKTENKLIATEDVRWGINRKSKLWVPKHKKRTGLEGKTLWDWLNLLATLLIPLVVVGATIGFGWWQVHLADLQHQNDQQLAVDQQQETTLTSYLNDMSDLLLNHNLGNSKSGDEVRQVARVRTLTTLRRLDANRNDIVLQFLQDAHLISLKNAVIDLSSANLSNDDLSGANLAGANLVDDSMAKANFAGANLGCIDQIYVSICADLSGATLSGANLRMATVTNEQLAKAKSLQGAIMPDGSKHP